MSEHDGFCVPVIEAMYFGVPIVAFDAGAVTETLGGAGILVREKDYQAVAEMLDLLLTDERLRSRILRGQEERLRHFKDTAAIEALLLKEIAGVMN